MGFFTFIKVMMILFNLAIFVSAGAVPTWGHPLSAVPPGWAVGLGCTLSLGAVGSLAPLVFPKPLVGGEQGTVAVVSTPQVPCLCLAGCWVPQGPTRWAPPICEGNSSDLGLGCGGLWGWGRG